DSAKTIDAQLMSLRSSISDLAYQVDSDKTKTAAALGSGVFLFLLAALAAYDLFLSKSGVWFTKGVSHNLLGWIALGLAVGSLILLAVGLARVGRRDVVLDVKLDRMEQEYAQLLERRKKLCSAN